MAIGYGEHDARQFAIVVSGILLDGFGADSVISIEPNSDFRSHIVGADGHVVSNKMADESAVATVTLLQTSQAHRSLLALYNSDRNARGGAGVGAFEMRDLINGDVDSSERCWIQRRPNREIGKEAKEYEWKFILAKWEQSTPT
jgi:hypothetical protein